MTDELFYWGGIPGRGEFVRLLYEDCRADYIDVGREPGGTECVQAMREHGFAPPIVRRGNTVISQTALICDELASRFGCVDPSIRRSAFQRQLTLLDLVTEVHETHHPHGMTFAFEEQITAARIRTRAFLSERLPKWLGYLERSLTAAAGTWQFEKFCYADLSLFHVVEGLRFAFPTPMSGAVIPRIRELCEAVTERPNVAAYRSSARWIPFNNHGIFRNYEHVLCAS